MTDDERAALREAMKFQFGALDGEHHPGAPGGCPAAGPQVLNHFSGEVGSVVVIHHVQHLDVGRHGG